MKPYRQKIVWYTRFFLKRYIRLAVYFSNAFEMRTKTTKQRVTIWILTILYVCVCCNAQECYTLKIVWESSGKATTWYIMTQHSSYFLNETLLCNLDVLFCKADRLQFLCVFQEVGCSPLVFLATWHNTTGDHSHSSSTWTVFESSGVLVSLLRPKKIIFSLWGEENLVAEKWSL